MMDEPPAAPIELAEPAPDGAEKIEPHLPTTTLSDGSVVIDLSALAPPPTQCVGREPDPFNHEIIVCRKTELSPRLGANYGPSADELTEGSAIPRARVRLSQDAEAEANVINKGVGGWNANGVEAKVKIGF